MKSILYIILFTQLTSGINYSQWITQDPYPTVNTLNSVSFIDVNTGWIAGDNGAAFKTTDGGNHWTGLSGLPGSYLNLVYLKSNSVGWVGADSGRLFKTINGGESWDIQLSVSTGLRFRAIYFYDELTAWIVGDSGKIFKSTDAGLNWLPVSSPVITNLYDIKFTSALNGFIAGVNYILHTTNGGMNWHETDLYGEFHSLSFSSPDIGWAAGSSSSLQGILYKTIDSGITWDWQFVSSGLSGLNSVSFFGPDTGYISGGWPFQQSIFKTTNGGINWIYQGDSSELYLNSMDMLNSQTGFTAGRAGVIYKTTDGGANWNSLRTGSTHDLEDVWFASNNTGWVFGNDILKTTNGGQNWNFIQKFYPQTIKSVCMLTPEYGFGVSGFGIFKTSDGWENYSLYTFPPPVSFNAISFTGPVVGWAVGDAGRMYKTTNAGTSWVEKLFGIGIHLLDVSFISDSVGWISGWYGFVIKTTNGGITWAPQFTGSNSSFDELNIISDQSGWMIGGGAVYHTSNGGTNWTIQWSGNNQSIYHLFMIDSLNGLATGNNFMISTSDGGANWIMYSGTGWFNGLYFLSPDLGWAVGRNGLIKRYGDIILSGNGYADIAEYDFKLYQNYPNPFNPSTVIRYSISSDNTVVRLRIYDALGRQVADLVNEKQNQGEHSVNFDAGNYPAGIYFYTLQTGANYLTRKMIILK